MDDAAFDALFAQFPDPVLLHAGSGWRLNPAASAFAPTEEELKILETARDGDMSLWLRDDFYRATPCSLEDGSVYYILQKDAFPSNAGENLASQLRQRVSSALLSLRRISKALEGTPDERIAARLADMNHNLYQIIRVAGQLEMAAIPIRELCQLTNIDFASFLNAFYQINTPLFQELNVAVTLDTVQRDLPVMADEEQLNYLLLNLISNAVKALPPSGGKIAIKLRNTKEQAILSISDNGSGLPPDLLTSPLWNQPGRISMDRGIGLGIPLSERIVAAHRGVMMAQSTPEGSKITIAFPLIPYDDNDLIFRSPGTPLDTYGGYDKNLIILSDVLPSKLYSLFD